MNPTTVLIIFAVAGILLALLTRKKPSEITRPADDLNCKPHQWTKPKDILGDELSTDLDEVLQRTPDKFEGSVVEAFAKGLTCKKCGYISGSKIAVDLKRWEEVVCTFLFAEKERQLIEKYLKRDKGK